MREVPGKIHSELNKRRQDGGTGIKTGDEIRNIKHEEPGRATVTSWGEVLFS